MMQENNDSILAFEYFTASGKKDKCIISEAEALIFSLLDDLKDFNIDLVINESYAEIVKNYDNVNPILIKGDVVDWLEDNASNFTKAIFIAAENNNNLYKISRILEKNNVKLYNSSAEACRISSDKFETYEDCEDIVIIEKIEDLTLDLDKIFKPGSRVIVQEYVEGTDVSVSLLSDGKKAIPISLNEQFVELKDDKGMYFGGKLPFESKYKQEAFEIATKAVESIDGLKGFVGVDLLINADEKDIYSVYLLEINSRFTTPYVGLKEIANFNIGKTIIEFADGEIKIDDLDISLDGEVEFKKSGDNLEIRRI